MAIVLALSAGIFHSTGVLGLPAEGGSATNAAASVKGPDVEALSDADMAKLSPEQLHALQFQIDEKVRQIGLSVSETRKDLMRLRTDARNINPEVRALDGKILELRKQIEQTIERIPEIKEKNDAVNQAQQKAIVLSKKKMKILALIAAVDAKPDSGR